MSLLTIKPNTFVISYDQGEEQIQTLNVTHKQFTEEELYRKNILEIKCLRCNFHCKFTHKIFKIKKSHSTNYFCETCNASHPTFKSLQEDHPFFEKEDLILVDKRTVGKSHIEIFAENEK